MPKTKNGDIYGKVKTIFGSLRRKSNKHDEVNNPLEVEQYRYFSDAKGNDNDVDRNLENEEEHIYVEVIDMPRMITMMNEFPKIKKILKGIYQDNALCRTINSIAGQFKSVEGDQPGMKGQIISAKKRIKEIIGLEAGNEDVENVFILALDIFKKENNDIEKRLVGADMISMVSGVGNDSDYMSMDGNNCRIEPVYENISKNSSTDKEDGGYLVPTSSKANKAASHPPQAAPRMKNKSSLSNTHLFYKDTSISFESCEQNVRPLKLKMD